jgi:hypothetical protein
MVASHSNNLLRFSFQPKKKHNNKQNEVDKQETGGELTVFAPRNQPFEIQSPPCAGACCFVLFCLMVKNLATAELSREIVSPFGL